MSHTTRHRFTHNSAPMDAPLGTRLAANDNPRPSFLRSLGIALLCAGTIYAAALLLHAASPPSRGSTTADALEAGVGREAGR